MSGNGMGLNLRRYRGNTPTHMPPFENATFATIAGMHGLKNMHNMPLKLVSQHIIPLEYYEGSYRWH
jgi:hypothetical protein